MKKALNSWHTSLAGLVILISLVLMSTEILTGDQFVSILGAVTAAGLFASKDDNG